MMQNRILIYGMLFRKRIVPEIYTAAVLFQVF
jgi:hypothetical protein